MALSFPASPSVNDTFTSGARTWTWSGTIWEITGSIAAAGSVGPAELAANAVTSAKLATSISLTGTPLAPTAAAATNTTQIATTQFVRTEVSNLVGTAGATLDTLGELATALGNDAALSTTLTTSIGLKAPLASPTLTGVPLAPTAAAGTNTTQLATTQFVTTAISNISVGAVPNFLVYFTGGNASVVDNAYLAYNTELYDDTNNVVNGVFTVPAGQAGVYQFNVAANCYNIGSSGYFRIQIVTAAIDINGSQTPAQGGTDVFSIASATLKLAVGDTVRARWRVPASGNYSAGIVYNNFSGVRIA